MSYSKGKTDNQRLEILYERYDTMVDRWECGAHEMKAMLDQIEVLRKRLDEESQRAAQQKIRNSNKPTTGLRPDSRITLKSIGLVEENITDKDKANVLPEKTITMKYYNELRNSINEAFKGGKILIDDLNKILSCKSGDVQERVDKKTSNGHVEAISSKDLLDTIFQKSEK